MSHDVDMMVAVESIYSLYCTADVHGYTRRAAPHLKTRMGVSMVIAAVRNKRNLLTSSVRRHIVPLPYSLLYGTRTVLYRE